MAQSEQRIYIMEKTDAGSGVDMSWKNDMKSGLTQTVVTVFVVAVACLLGVSSATPQAAPQDKARMAEDVFSNVQVLKGIPVDEFMETMGFISASLGLNCVDCHTPQSEGNWAHFADDT